MNSPSGWVVLVALAACGSSAGPTGDAHAPGTVDVAAGGASGACMLDTRYIYRFDGPELPAFFDQTLLVPERSFKRSRTFNIDKRDPVSCETVLPDCGAADIDVGEISAALGRREVQMAFATAPSGAVFGAADPFGRGWHLSRGDGRSITVHGDCGDGCGPAGIRELVTLLGALDKQELARPACADLAIP